MGHLNELHAKYFDKGLRIVAISDEPASKLESIMIKNHEAKFWIASDPGRSLLSVFGGGGIPHAYLIDATGKIVTNKHPGSMSESEIAGLLEGAFDAKLDRELHKSLKSLVKTYEKGQYGKAWAGAAKKAEDEDRAVAADASYLKEQCEAVAGFHKKLVENAVGAKDYASAYDLLAEIGKAFSGMEIADWAAEQKKTLDGDQAVALEMKAWKAYLKAVGQERKAGGKEKKLKPAITSYKRIVKKYPDTRAGRMAQDALTRLGG